MEEETKKNIPKICKYFLKNKCLHGDQCKFIHDSNVCRNYFFDGICKRGDTCKFKHEYKLLEKEINDKKENKNNETNLSKYDKNKERNKQNRRPKNTENFKPSHDRLDMNILVSPHDTESFYKSIYDVNDVVLVPDFIKELDNHDTYQQLIHEIQESGINESELWKSWHGDTHFIADDNLHWKEKVPTFSKILEKIEKYFHFEIKSTRLNWYKNTNDWKPYHHDAAAIKENIAKKQNFTIGVSFGYTRAIAFENAKTKTTVSIPMTNGSAYAFSKDININWKHGIPQIHPDMYSENGRISIIAWGQVQLSS